jgi:hypothetical protein
MNFRGEEVRVGTQGYHGDNGGTTSSSVNDCLTDLFDNFLSLEDSEEDGCTGQGYGH